MQDMQQYVYEYWDKFNQIHSAAITGGQQLQSKQVQVYQANT